MKDTSKETVTVEVDETLEEIVFGDESLKAPHLATAEERAERRAQAIKALEFAEIPRVKSKDIIGKKFDILDATRGQIKGEDVAVFIINLDGEKRSVSKKLNTFTQMYLDIFGTYIEGETPEPMCGYTFVEIEGGSAGNKPVVLQKLDVLNVFY